MSRVLLAEDSVTQAAMIRIQLQLAGLEVEVARDGAAALRALDSVLPDIVLTDLQMPEMDGVQLVEAIRRRRPSLPVILTTSRGSEDLALQALRKGAVSYVPKPEIECALAPTLRQAVEIAQAVHDDERLRQSLTACDGGFLLPSDPSLVMPLVAYCKHELARGVFADETGILQVATALAEALETAIYRGNLEMDEDLRWQEPESFEQLVQQRRREAPYRDRRVRFTLTLSPSSAVFVVRHEGPAVELAPQVALDLDTIRGRGAYLIHTFMDKVQSGERELELTVNLRNMTSATPFVA